MPLIIGQWLPSGSAAWGLIVLSLSITSGLALGAVRVRGVRLGVAGVLFSALVFGQLGMSIDRQVLEFLQDFALILFVYAIGLQVGPGFTASLKAEGLRLNLFSLAAVALGAVMTFACVRLAHLPKESASGIYAGAYTTTPGLAAGQEVLQHATPNSPARTEAAVAMAGLAYTVTYPFGAVGPILVIVLLRRIFRVNVGDELAALNAADQARRPQLEVVNFEVTSAEHAGFPLNEHPILRGTGVMFTRLLRQNEVLSPSRETEVRVGDIYRAFGPSTRLAEVVAAMGRPSEVDLGTTDGSVRRMDLVVTRTQVLRRPLRELDLIRRTGVTLGRVTRAGVDLIPGASFKLQFGDRVTAVGPEAGLQVVEAELGNSDETLNRPQLVPIFLGIVLGVIVGSVPLFVPGLDLRIRIGLAGGPMLAAIALSQLGNIGAVVWYMPVAANQLFRDFGLAVFLACVGLKSGDHFVQRVASGAGLSFALWGAAVTMLPVLLVGIVARLMYRMNFVTLSGWVAGAMTSSPALLFANEQTRSSAAAVSYAAVAPLGMLSPILCAQFLVICLN